MSGYLDIYDENDDQNTWFEKLKRFAEEKGFAAETKEFKKNPTDYKGHIGDIAMVLRIAITGRTMSPDTYAVMPVSYTHLMRTLRILCFLLTICLPAIFVALLTFHSQMLPTDLVMSIIAAREGVPIPAVLECLLLLLVFEIIRETGIRVPASIGQPLSIVGALVLGDAAINAKYVSAPMVIIVAMACLAGLMVQNLKSSILVYRIVFLLAASIFGIYGFLFVFIFMSFHVLGLNSFSVPYASYSPLNKFEYQKDVVFRAPWWKMINRSTSPNRRRQKIDSWRNEE